VKQLLGSLNIGISGPFEGAILGVATLAGTFRDTASQANRDRADSLWLDWCDEGAHIRLAILKGMNVLPQDYQWPSQKQAK